MKFFLLINVKLPTIVDILTFMSKKNSILGLCGSEKKKAEFLNIFYIYELLKVYAQLSWAWKKFYNLGPWYLSRFTAVPGSSPTEVRNLFNH